jgi:hypothetical protein
VLLYSFVILVITCLFFHEYHNPSSLHTITITIIIIIISIIIIITIIIITIIILPDATGHKAEHEWIGVATVAGCRRVVMCQEVRDEVEAVVGEGWAGELLLDMCRNRLLPTPWLNQVRHLKCFQNNCNNSNINNSNSSNGYNNNGSCYNKNNHHNSKERFHARD